MMEDTDGVCGGGLFNPIVTAILIAAKLFARGSNYETNKLVSVLSLNIGWNREYCIIYTSH